MIRPDPAAYRSPEAEAGRFQQITAGVDWWATADELVAVLDEAGFWSREWTGDDEAKAAFVRRLCRQLHDEGRLWPLWASRFVFDVDSEQRVERFKPEARFTVGDYKTIVSYFGRLGSPFRSKARGYARRCWAKFHVRLDTDR